MCVADTMEPDLNYMYEVGLESTSYPSLGGTNFNPIVPGRVMSVALVLASLPLARMRLGYATRIIAGFVGQRMSEVQLYAYR